MAVFYLTRLKEDSETHPYAEHERGNIREKRKE